MELVHVINHPSRIHDITFYQDEEGCDLLLVGAEDRKVSVYAISSSKTPRILAELIGHENRYVSKASNTVVFALVIVRLNVVLELRPCKSWTSILPRGPKRQ
jgi:protein MAK11